MHRALPGPVLLAAALLVSVLAATPAGAQQTPGLSEARRRADQAAAEVNRLESELGELGDQVARLEEDRRQAEADLEGLRARVRHVAIERYTDAGQHRELVLAADINEQERARALARIVTQSDSDAIDEYRLTKEHLDRTSDELEGRLADQREAVDELRSRRADLDRELARLEAEEAERIAAERRAAEDAARAAAEAARPAGPSSTTVPSPGPAAVDTGGSPTTSPSPLPTVAAPPAPVSGGGWICPVQGARSFVDSWGAPRGGGRAHQGVDIMSPRGTPVVIPVSGVVTLKTGGIGGLTFRLAGDDGNWYYGAHLDSYAGAEGRLPAGTVVGTVGDTGDAKGTGTHLHFEIHIGGYGNPVNPYPTVSAHC